MDCLTNVSTNTNTNTNTFSPIVDLSDLYNKYKDNPNATANQPVTITE